MRRLLLAASVLALGGCKTLDIGGEDLWDRLRAPSVADPAPVEAEQPDRPQPVSVYTPEKAFPRQVKKDNGRELGAVGARFDGAPLDEVVRAVMTEMLGVNMLIEPGEYPSVSFVVDKTVPREEIIRLLQNLSVQSKARLFFADGVYQLTHDVPDSANQRVMRLKHRLPSEFLPFGAGEGPVRVIPDDKARALVLSGNPAAVAAVAQTIEDLDVPAFDGVVFRWLAVREGRQIANVLDRVGPLSVSQMPFGEGILVWGPDGDVRRVEKLVAMLAEHGEATSFVYELHSLDSSKCVELAGAGGGSGGGYQQMGARVPPSVPGSPAGSGSAPFLDKSQPLTPMSPQATMPQPTALSVTPLEGRCVLRGARSDVMELLEVLRMVDRPAIRIDFQAALFEVKLTDELRFGVRAFLDRQNQGGGYPIQARSSDVATVTEVLSKVPGGVAVLPFSDWRIAVDALRGKTIVNVLAEPSAGVDAGEAVNLQVGDQVPVVTSQSQSEDTGRVQSQVNYRDVGVILNIKPTVRSGGMLKLVVKMEVSEAQRTTVAAVDSPTISRRGIETVVTVANGQTVLLGGLLRESGQDIKTGLPVVSEIPVVGGLFSQTGKSRERQELALLITPRIVDEVAISTKARVVMDRIAALRLGKL